VNIDAVEQWAGDARKIAPRNQNGLFFDKRDLFAFQTNVW
jgi:hypothetical protein